LVIEFQTDEKFGSAIMEVFNQAKIPVIAIDIPMPGATFFGANNHRAGRLGGEAAGRYAKEHWSGKVDKILSLELPQSGDLPAQRMKGQIDGVRSLVDVPDEDVIHLDSKNTLEEARRVVSNTLGTIPDAHHLIVVCINDGTALGAIAALESARRQQDAIVVSQNADPTARAELRRPGTILLGSVAYFPEKYGDHLIPLALKRLQGQTVPEKNYVDHVLITRENVDQYYPEQKKGEET
jgi:ribose transport system substrate-binding protein